MRATITKQNQLLTLFSPVLMLLGLTIGYWPLFLKLVGQWESGDNDYCYLVVPLVLYLCWEKRESFRFAEFSWNPLGLLLGLPAVGLIYAGQLGSVETLVFIGLWGLIVAGCLTLYGRRAGHLFFPLLILLFIVPLPAFINRNLTFNMKMLASALSAVLLRLSGITVLLEGNVLDLGVQKMQVVDACSGLRYMVSMVLMALLVCYYFVRDWWRWVAVFALVGPLMILVNGMRIFSTGLLLLHGYPQFAEGGYHDAAGLVLFMVAGVILYGVASQLRKVGSSAWVEKRDVLELRVVRRGWQLLLVVGFCLLTIASGLALQKISTSPTHPPREKFASFPMVIDGWRGEWHYLSKEILAALWADDYVNATYQKTGSSGVIYLLIPFYEYQGTEHTAHAPQSCLLGGGFSLTRSAKRLVPVGQGKTLEVMTMVLDKGESRMLGSYFFLQRGRVITSPWLNKFYLMWDSMAKKRTDGALVRVEMSLAPNQEVEAGFAELEKFLGQIWPLLPKYVPE